MIFQHIFLFLSSNRAFTLVLIVLFLSHGVKLDFIPEEDDLQN